MKPETAVIAGVVAINTILILINAYRIMKLKKNTNNHKEVHNYGKPNTKRRTEPRQEPEGLL